MGNSLIETYTVSGNSMNPLLHNGDRVQVQASQKYNIGDIVVATHPIQTDLTIIKQIQSIQGNAFQLKGINKSESSDNFGLVTKEKIIGKVISDLD